ncbi:hypothetical protein UT300009_30760 [Paraclostridium bifermentans]
MDFKLYEKCSNCEEYKTKRCKGYKFSIKIESLHCKNFTKYEGK